MLPTSYVLQQEFTYISEVHYYGGFADVSKGEYLGCCVAVKRLRIGTKDPSNKIFKVCKFQSTSHLAVTQFVLSGFARKS